MLTGYLAVEWISLFAVNITVILKKHNPDPTLALKMMTSVVDGIRELERDSANSIPAAMTMQSSAALRRGEDVTLIGGSDITTKPSGIDQYIFF